MELWRIKLNGKKKWKKIKNFKKNLFNLCLEIENKFNMNENN
jgi:hypothetical protein